jgi:hypothetical protein
MKGIKVHDQYRKNPLSLEPGGVDVSVVMRDGFRLVYDKVKNPAKYIGKLHNRESIISIEIDGQVVWDETDPEKFWDRK